MAHLNNLIDDIVCGEDRLLGYSVEDMDELDGDTLTKAWLTVKVNEDDLDASALYNKEITTSLSAHGQIDIAGGGSPVTDAHLFFILTRTETALATPDIYYFYQVRVRSSGDADKVVDAGRMIFRRTVKISLA